MVAFISANLVLNLEGGGGNFYVLIKIDKKMSELGE